MEEASQETARLERERPVRRNELQDVIDLLSEGRAELNRSTDAWKRRTLRVYCEYLRTKLARLQADGAQCERPWGVRLK